DAPTWGGLRLQALGTGGQVQIDAFAQHVGGPGRWLPYGSDLDALLLEAFLDAVREGRAVDPTGEVGRRPTRVVAAAREPVPTGPRLSAPGRARARARGGRGSARPSPATCRCGSRPRIPAPAC